MIKMACIYVGLKSAKSDDNNCNLEDFTNPSVIFTPEDVYYQWRLTKNAAIGSKEDGGVDLILGSFAQSFCCPVYHEIVDRRNLMF